MKFVPMTPTGAVAECVEAAFHLSEYDPEHSRERLVPDGAISLVIELDGQVRSVYDNETGKPIQSCSGAWVSGVHTRYVTFDTPKGTELVAVRFRAGEAASVLGTPISRFNDRIEPAIDVLGDEIAQLRDDLSATEGSREKLERLESWLGARYQAQWSPPASVRRAVSTISEAPTASNLKTVFDNSGVSRKHLAGLFKKFVGPTPKLFQRIRRFAQVFQVLNERSQEIDWADVSLECGYFDQAHFIRDFRNFSGLNPAPFGERSDDRVNFFPDDDR